MKNEQIEDNDGNHCRSNLYELFINAIPVFHPNMSVDTRNLLSKKFSDQFEERWRTSFDDDVGSNHDEPDDDAYIRNYMIWLRNFYNDLGVKASIKEEKGKIALRIPQCPWMTDNQDNPVFFLLCRTIFSRSLSWASMSCQLKQTCKRKDSVNTCLFEVIIK